MAGNVATVQSTKSGQLFLTTPKAIANLKGWKKGTKLEFIEDKFGDVILKEVRE